MTKGTPSQGKKASKKLHIRCRRCGKPSYHSKKRVCSSCGYGATATLRKYSWQKKYKLKRLSHIKKDKKKK